MAHHQFIYEGADDDLKSRQMLNQPLEDFHSHEISIREKKKYLNEAWKIRLGKKLLFNRHGLGLIQQALIQYQGMASQIQFRLQIDSVTRRNYYPGIYNSEETAVGIPVSAFRDGVSYHGEDKISLTIPVSSHFIPFPAGLCPSMDMAIPKALLMSYGSEFDLLFANQISVLNNLSDSVRRSPCAWWKCFVRGRWTDLPKQLALNFNQIHSSAQVHSTAVVEGSFIGPGAVIGAHCVVRYSMIGKDARLHDGAKAEFSIVGEKSWLMHDLVLYRCLVEDHVFLIHGPYQFSFFQSRSAAFASIMMDYRPDAKSIKISTPEGPREYRGRFLGAVLKEGAKTLGGCLLAPGAIVPQNVWLGVDSRSVHGKMGDVLPTNQLLSPAFVTASNAKSVSTAATISDRRVSLEKSEGGNQ